MIVEAPPRIMIRSPLQIFASRRHHNQWLVLIASYKLLQALLFVSIGLGARHSRLVNFLLDKAELLNDPILRRIGLVAFGYSAISMIEGIGLYFEKVWAEYMTLAITASFLPWEIFEIARRLTLIRVSLLGANLLVFFYLLQLVADRAKSRRKERHTS